MGDLYQTYEMGPKIIFQEYYENIFWGYIPDPEVRVKIYPHVIPHRTPHPHSAPRTRTSKPHLAFCLTKPKWSLKKPLQFQLTFKVYLE